MKLHPEGEWAMGQNHPEGKGNWAILKFLMISSVSVNLYDQFEI